MISETFTIGTGAHFIFKVKGAVEGGSAFIALRCAADDAIIMKLDEVPAGIFRPVDWDLSEHPGVDVFLEIGPGDCAIAECCMYDENVLDAGAVFLVIDREKIVILDRKRLGRYYRADTFRPLFHFTPVKNWINDPCGLIQWKGLYHLFCQYHPYSSFWGPMHWSHAVSRDLVHWRHLPIALAPDASSHADDFSGIFTGSAVAHNGELAIVYTDHRDMRYHPDRIMQSQALATSADGVMFKKFPENPVIGVRPEEASEDFRDPKVWREGDEWRMVLGTSYGGRGKIILYGSADLVRWEYRGVLYRAERDGIGMFECPDFFTLDGRRVLIASVVEEREGKKEFYAVAMTGMLQHGAFVPAHRARLDFGPDFYAPQTFLDDRGRRIVIAWMENWGNQFVTHTRGWTGALTLPRELSLDDGGRLVQRPVEEVRSLRNASAPLIELQGRNLDTSIVPLHDSLELFEMIITFQPLEDDARCGIVIANRDGEELSVYHDAGKSAVVIDRSRLSAGERGVYEAHVSRPDDGMMDMHIFCDRSSVELFACGYSVAGTARAYLNNPEKRVDVFSLGRVHITRCALWELDTAW